jgi:glycosyltransferase involved in cell wall biosynthesis
MSDPSLPTISVVMGVYNAERTVRQAVDSILSQTYKDWELIIVNDGSTDSTGKILAEYADTDARVRVIEQANQGLTRSLITGTALARGQYIARQDADDISLPCRFQRQLETIEPEPDCVLVTSWVEDVSPEGVRCGLHKELHHKLRLLSGNELTLDGIAAHGSVLMRRVTFEKVGGYRSCFYYAQDSDLWLRLSSQGMFLVVPEILYQRIVGIDSISSRFRQAQSRFCELAQSSFRETTAGNSDASCLSEAEELAQECRIKRGQPTSPSEIATSMLLLASQLTKRNPSLARNYLWKAIRTCPTHWRSWKALLIQSLTTDYRNGCDSN